MMIQPVRYHLADTNFNIGFTEHKRGRSATVSKCLRNSPRCSRRAPALRDKHHCTRRTPAILGMMYIDNLAINRVKPTPETERVVEHQCHTACATRHQDPGLNATSLMRHDVAQLSSSTSPATADSTHSARLPRTTCTGNIPGA